MCYIRLFFDNLFNHPFFLEMTRGAVMIRRIYNGIGVETSRNGATTRNVIGFSDSICQLERVIGNHGEESFTLGFGSSAQSGDSERMRIVSRGVETFTADRRPPEVPIFFTNIRLRASAVHCLYTLFLDGNILQQSMGAFRERQRQTGVLMDKTDEAIRKNVRRYKNRHSTIVPDKYVSTQRGVKTEKSPVDTYVRCPFFIGSSLYPSQCVDWTDVRYILGRYSSSACYGHADRAEKQVIDIFLGEMLAKHGESD